MQSYKILWFVNNWNVTYLLECSTKLVAFLPMCVWHVLVCEWKVGSLETCWLSGASAGGGILPVCLLFWSRSSKSSWKWLGHWGREKTVAM